MNDTNQGDATPRLSSNLNIRLSAMMFFQYAIWGAWLPLLYPFLANHHKFTDAQIGNMFAIGAIGAIVSPFIAGQVADRYFSTERFLGISHLIGAVLVWQLASIDSYSGFLWFSLIYSLVYSPTLSLTNSLAFHHIPDRDRDFGRIRTWGTVGWIVVGITIGQWLLRNHSPAELEGVALAQKQYAGMADAFRLSAVLGAVMGVFCFFLPHTPPSNDVAKNATFAALSDIKKQPLLMLFLLAVPVSCIHQFYFVHTSQFLGEFQSDTASKINGWFGVGGGGLMTVGQMSEIAVLALIPLFAAKVARKSLLAVGLAAYALRMAIFAYTDVIPESVRVPALMFGVALHGLCFGCFIFVAFMIVDEETNSDVRASAQSLFNLVIIGIGIIVGSKIATGVKSWSTTKVLDETAEDGYRAVTDYTQLFSVPMWASVVCLLVLIALYPKGSKRIA